MSNNTNKKYRSQSKNRRISLIVTYTILAVMAVIWLIPLLWIFISAFRCEYQPDGTFIGRVTSNFFPRAVGFENFRLLFTETERRSVGTREWMRLLRLRRIHSSGRPEEWNKNL